MKSRPEASSVSAAASAQGTMHAPGCSSMRNVSSFRPPHTISAFAKAAPAFVARVPSTRSVEPCVAPVSSSVTIRMACWAAGASEPSSADARAVSVSPLARSTTSGGRSS